MNDKPDLSSYDLDILEDYLFGLVKNGRTVLHLGKTPRTTLSGLSKATRAALRTGRGRFGVMHGGNLTAKQMGWWTRNAGGSGPFTAGSYKKYFEKGSPCAFLPTALLGLRLAKQNPAGIDLHQLVMGDINRERESAGNILRGSMMPIMEDLFEYATVEHPHKLIEPLHQLWESKPRATVHPLHQKWYEQWEDARSLPKLTSQLAADRAANEHWGSW